MQHLNSKIAARNGSEDVPSAFDITHSQPSDDDDSTLGSKGLKTNVSKSNTLKTNINSEYSQLRNSIDALGKSNVDAAMIKAVQRGREEKRCLQRQLVDAEMEGRTQGANILEEQIRDIELEEQIRDLELEIEANVTVLEGGSTPQRRNLTPQYSRINDD
jgi:hypothetical protein